ncbi:SCP-like protein [Ancylostoma duodenale]|uniref:SCP-like protein n=1 Tax=Ancylostoma duodenale TaxID=51022 RepID=A0A0C2GS82_9BILA|nr:SCP-like protein [Ancylostoma duodenale]
MSLLTPTLLAQSLIIVICSAKCPGNSLTEPQRKLLTKLHNDIRRQIAQGMANNYNGGKLPAGKNIYKLKYSCDLEKAAADATGAACSASLANPQKYGQNIQLGFFRYVVPSVIASPKNDLLEAAVKQWYLPAVYYGLRDPNNKFTDPRLYNFVNYSKKSATNQNIRDRFGIAAIAEKLRRIHLGWYGRVLLDNGSTLYKKDISFEVKGRWPNVRSKQCRLET